METISYRASCALQINNRGLNKPNEDFLLVDDRNHIFIILDGITRVHQEYTDRPGESAACDVNRIFSETAYRYLLENLHTQSPDALLFQAAAEGNRALVAYRQQRSPEQWQFYPGTLGILCLLQGDRLHYLYVGDCQGTLLRRSTKLHFGQQGSSEALELMKISKQDRYAIYCNHPEHPLGYGIFNGDSEATALFEQASIRVQPGDQILLSTDGAAKYIRYAKAAALSSRTPEQIIADSQVYDQPPFAKYADDKGIIKLTFPEA
jgi:serine/threonine protein phosphatase PrpC